MPIAYSPLILAQNLPPQTSGTKYSHCSPFFSSPSGAQIEPPQTFGYTAEEALGQNISILVPPEHKNAHDGYIQRYLETGEKRVIGRERQVLAVTKDGKYLLCMLKLNELVVAEERMFVGMLYDITEMARLLETVEQVCVCV